MKVNLGLDLSDEKLIAIGVILTGKPRKATRAQVKEFTEGLIRKALSPSQGSTELKNFVCPKCSKPIALPTPKAKAAPEASAPAAASISDPKRAKAISDVKAAALSASEATNAMYKALKALGDLPG